jgi:hypothetical protein
MLRLLHSPIIQLADYLSKVPKPLIIAVGYLYVFGWDLINYVTGQELRFTIFYGSSGFLVQQNDSKYL